MSKLEQINAFITVIEENGFASAARILGVSTPAISRQINKLEAALQVKLLHRTTRQLKLTDIGHEYYQQVHKTLHELNSAEKLIQSSQDLCQGTLKIMSNHYFAFHYLIPHLAKFMELHPKLYINLELSERFPNLALENIDLIFGVNMPYAIDLVQKKVASTHYILCASPAYLNKHGLPLTPSDLKNHAYITHSKRQFKNELNFKNGQKILLEPILALNDSKAMCECAINGIGITKLHAYTVETAINNGKLIEVLKDFQEPQQNIYLYYQQTQYLQPKIRRFIDFFLKD